MTDKKQILTELKYIKSTGHFDGRPISSYFEPCLIAFDTGRAGNFVYDVPRQFEPAQVGEYLTNVLICHIMQHFVCMTLIRV
jgi:hypothetical protein